VAASVVERGGAVAAAGEPAVAVAEARAVPSRERLVRERTVAIAERAGRERQLRCGMLRAPVIIASVSSVGRIIFIGCVTSRSFQRLASPKSTINCRSSGVAVFQIVHISSRSARPTAARVVPLGFPQIATTQKFFGDPDYLFQFVADLLWQVLRCALSYELRNKRIIHADGFGHILHRNFQIPSTYPEPAFSLRPKLPPNVPLPLADVPSFAAKSARSPQSPSPAGSRSCGGAWVLAKIGHSQEQNRLLDEKPSAEALGLIAEVRFQDRQWGPLKCRLVELSV
jgi:hypothetical protein